MATGKRTNKDGEPIDSRVDEALTFLQELTGIPARSIGSQIPITPSTPQASNPLASSGLPPSDTGLSTLFADDAVTQIDVMPGMPSVDVNVPTIDRSDLEISKPVPPPIPDDLYFDPPSMRQDDSKTPQEIYSGPIDQEVVDAGGNPRMARRTDLTHEEKMQIARGDTASRVKPSAWQMAEDIGTRQAYANVVQDYAPDIAAQLLAGKHSDDDARNLAYGFTEIGEGWDPGVENGPEPPPRGYDPFTDDTPRSAPANQSPTTSQTVPNSSETPNSSSPQRPQTSQPQPTGAPDTGRQSPPPPTEPYPALDPGGNPRGPEQQHDYTRVFAAAEQLIEANDEILTMIVDALMRLTLGYERHRSRLSNILDRLDSELDANEFGEGDSY